VVDKPKLTDHQLVEEVANKLHADVAQVLIAWGAQKGFSVIPKSVQDSALECRAIDRMFDHYFLPQPASNRTSSKLN
jgi:diketogulonate reductase-like aldo/keto reductase